MPPIVKIYRSGELVCKTQGTCGETLLQCITSSGVFLDSPCGGNGKCGKCLVRLSTDGETVPACRITVSGNTSVYLPDTMEMQIIGGNSAQPQCGGTAQPHRLGAAKPRYGVVKPRYGVALDIGTTTVAAHLTDLESGIRIATVSGVNAQRAYGADVISRIKYCTENGHGTLTQLIRGQIKSLITEACAVSGTRSASISYISIAANTIMEHLAADLSPAGMGAVPFTPVSLFGEELPIWDNSGICADAKVYYAPAVSSFVGGDITAGLLAAGFEGTPEPALFIDIGTNGEIVLKSNGVYYCCAAAAGPAFEGAEISQGMAAVSGAISHVRWNNGPELSVIGNRAAYGLCGCGLLDALAILVETGAVDETGRMRDADDINHGISQFICKVDGQNAFCLSKENGGIYLTAADVRKLQLAKSAIAAGIQTLLWHTGVRQEDIKSFVLAGGFGSYMDIHSAARIGLFPSPFLPVSKTPGNTAGEGAALALCAQEARTKLRGIRERCEYVELSGNPVFNEQFTEQMWFSAQ